MIQITRKIITGNQYNTNSIIYLVVHDTGNPGVGATADANARYFAGGDRGASAHAFVDDHSIVQIIEFNHGAWHVGDGGNKYGINNQNSIGIEICVNADGNYAQAVSNAVEYVASIMKQYNIPMDKLVRHYDASHKNCPASMNKDGKWTDWITFKNRVAALLNQPPVVVITPTSDNNTLDIQKKINRLKIATLVEDGISGPNTIAAIKKLQSILGLTQDGQFGPTTEGVVNSILNKPLLKIGSKGVEVRYLQFRIGSSIDGDFGPGTRLAVMRFQGANADGVVGPQTWAKLIG